MKILYGIYRPDSGVIKVKGVTFDFLTPRKAIELGIGMVHQEFMLVKEMTVLENIILGAEPRKSFNRIDFEKAKEKIEKYITQYGLEVNLDKKVENISVGEAQRVEIIKTLYRGAEILILDEPTAVLTPQEAEKLFEILYSLKKNGKSVIFISHKLREVMRISDRITVMRDGRHVKTVNKEDITIRELAKMMVGREIFLTLERKPVSYDKKEPVLEVKDIYVPGESELSKIRGISFEIYKGEILGIAGVDGNGQRELEEALTGLRKIEKGDVIFENRISIKNLSPLKIRELGIAHIPEDRNVRGLNKSFTLMENLTANIYYKRPYSRWMALNKPLLREFSLELIKKFNIRPSDPEALVGNLSGGNAQKVVVAREMSTNVKLLIASQPTRGVDIGSIETIRRILNEAKEKGISILLISADLDEILSLSDRIAIIYEGKITGIISADEATEEKLGLLMTGGH